MNLETTNQTVDQTMNTTVDQTVDQTMNTTVEVPVMTYEEKMNFLQAIRVEIGLEKNNSSSEEFVDESPKGKYIDFYNIGTI